MAYIGRSPVYGAFYKQTITIDGSSTTYALDYTVASSNQILVVLGGVLQEPGSAYVVTGSGTQILFTETPTASTSCYIVYLGETLTQARTAEVEPAYEEATGDGAETDFTLTNGPVVLAGILVFVDGIQQTPTDNFTLVDGSTVSFTSAPAAGAQIDFYIKCVERTMFAAPSNGAVTSAKIADGAVTAAKLGTVYAANITGLGPFATTSTLYTANISGLGTIATQAANSVNLTGGSLSGISSIGVADVAVANIVVSGNLTVDGTITTINSTTLTVDDKNIELASAASPSDAAADGGGITLKGTTDKTITWSNTTKAWTVNQGFNIQQVIENAQVSGTALTGTANVDVLNGAVWYYTANTTGNWTVNVRGDSSTQLNSVMPTNTTVSIAVLATQGSTAYYPSGFQVDGTSVTPKWSGGSAPSSGNASGIDLYTYTIAKTASGTYTVLATQTQFA